MVKTSFRKGFKTAAVEFVDRVHGTGFPEIRLRKPLSAIPVEFVDVVTGIDGYFCDNAKAAPFA